MSWWQPHIPDPPAHYEPWSRKRMLIASLIALVVVSAVTVAFVAPAELGRDPTGIGAALRLDELGNPPHAEPEEPEIQENVTQLNTYSYSYAFDNVLFHDDDGTLVEGESTTIDLAVDRANVTAVTAILRWQDAATVGEPQPDTFALTLTGPPGTDSVSGANEGANGMLNASVTASAPPSPGNVSAKTSQAARLAIEAANPASMKGSGNWTIGITLSDVADLVGDNGNDWSLQVFVETYKLVLGAGETSPIQEVTVNITVEAFGPWVEYKVFIAEGDTLEYEWSATGELQYDMHGRRPTGQESSHETGDSDGEAGTLIVPFTGQHGWAWKNNGASDVEITLVVRGPFILLG